MWGSSTYELTNQPKKMCSLTSLSCHENDMKQIKLSNLSFHPVSFHFISFHQQNSSNSSRPAPFNDYKIQNVSLRLSRDFRLQLASL